MPLFHPHIDPKLRFRPWRLSKKKFRSFENQNRMKETLNVRGPAEVLLNQKSKNYGIFDTLFMGFRSCEFHETVICLTIIAIVKKVPHESTKYVSLLLLSYIKKLSAFLSSTFDDIKKDNKNIYYSIVNFTASNCELIKASLELMHQFSNVVYRMRSNSIAKIIRFSYNLQKLL